MAGTVNLKSKISLDDSALVGGMKRVQRSVAAVATKASRAFRKVGAGIAKAAAKMKNFALIAGALTFGAAIAGAYKLARALKDAFDLGGRLSDLSAQTGIAVDQLAILQQAFEDNGVAGDQVGTVMNKLQRSITDFGAGLSTQSRAFERLGISFDQIKGKSPIEQFNMVQNAIANIEDPTLKAATAMELFGRSGGDLLALFQDSGAIEKASVTMGSSAEILAVNAEKFDRISDLLNRASVKFQGIILALSEVAAPKILEALEKFNQMDFAGIGRRFIAGLTIEKAKALLIGALKVAGAFFGNKLIQAVRLVAHLTEVAFTYVFEKITGDFGKKMMGHILSLAKINMLPPHQRIKKIGGMLKDQLNKAGEDGITLEDKLLKAADALKDKITKDEDPFGFKNAVEEFQDDLADVMQSGKVKLDEKKAEANDTPVADLPPIDSTDSSLYDAALANAKLEREKLARMANSSKNISQSTASSISPSVRRLGASMSQVSGGLSRNGVQGASGLTTGGLGSKRYTNPAREAARIAKEQKKDTREQINVLRDVDSKLAKGLGLNS